MESLLTMHGAVAGLHRHTLIYLKDCDTVLPLTVAVLRD